MSRIMVNCLNNLTTLNCIDFRSFKVKKKKENERKVKNRISCQGYWLVVYHQKVVILGREVMFDIDTRNVPL